MIKNVIIHVFFMSRNSRKRFISHVTLFYIGSLAGLGRKISNEVSKVGNCSRGRPEGSLFNSYYTKVQRRTLLLFLDCSTLTSIYTLYCGVLSKEVSSTILKVFGMTRPGTEPRSSGPLAKEKKKRKAK